LIPKYPESQQDCQSVNCIRHHITDSVWGTGVSTCFAARHSPSMTGNCRGDISGSLSASSPAAPAGERQRIGGYGSSAINLFVGFNSSTGGIAGRAQGQVPCGVRDTSRIPQIDFSQEKP
jgi:hypothetical protein